MEVSFTCNELARAKRRGESITESGSGREETVPGILSPSSVDSDSLSGGCGATPANHSDRAASQTLSTVDVDVDSLSCCQPAKKKARRTVDRKSSSESRRVYMHGGHNDGKTAKPWDKEAKRQRKSSVSNLYFESYCSYSQTQ